MTADLSLGQPEKPLILIVDDDPIIRRLIRFSMEREGYEVTEASDGKAGLEMFKKRIPDIVLLDFMMPIMNGLEFCRQLKILAKNNFISEVENEKNQPHLTLIETERFDISTYRKLETGYPSDLPLSMQSEELLSMIARTPVLMITALEDDESVSKAFDAGATDFITKPINWAILRQRVRHLIHQAKLYQRLEATNVELQKLAALDPLTQLANRRVFDLMLERQWRLMIRNTTFLSIIFVDIDYFKSYNDTYGHQAGDHCLFEVAQAISAQVQRPTDLVARYGGEEIIAILPDTPLQGAKLVAQNILTAVRDLAIPHQNSQVIPFVTVSVGAASMQPDYQSSPQKLLAIADAALYEAKAQGRNCMVIKRIAPEQ